MRPSGRPCNTFTACSVAGVAPFPSTVDQVRVWARSLTATEVQTEYSAGVRRAPQHHVIAK